MSTNIKKVISSDGDFANFKRQYRNLLSQSKLGNVKVVVNGKYNKSLIAKDWLAQRGFLMSKSTRPLMSPSATNNYMYLKRTHSPSGSISARAWTRCSSIFTTTSKQVRRT